MTPPVTPELSRFVSSLLVHCVDIRAVWSTAPAESAFEAPPDLHELLIFADVRTLNLLRRSASLHRADVRALVVFDGEQFENAWGAWRQSGSLARCAWRQVGPDVAYYDESRWTGRSSEGATLERIRRKALLLWGSAAYRPSRS